ncbi:helix-turn-helix domain-containing protein [Pelosinus baikalensis]|jgi:transcriptional regulator with XRE-family HTH domain|uniref:Helix-turn-helix domain-containing protein n=1 Tax=Pelosinus baikalensis TaxID=2892015 RepID=A0ABS8HRS0_9FIRM|nr:helix-turn-helix transcriptional regulator [Pelosinus baikalensis]MCC5465775.1 helix-turn-helix domain-containing protein [Pelosinus baikalensis]
MTFGENLRKIRKGKRISQTKLFSETGFPQTTISDWENDKYLPDVMEALKLAAVLKVTLSKLLNGKFKSPKPKAS